MNFILSTIFFTGIFGWFSVKYHERIADAILKIPLPKVVLSFGALTLISIVEENLNCPTTGCFALPEALFPYTVKNFLILFAFLLLIIKIFKIKRYRYQLFAFGVIGWMVEFLTGGWKEWLWTLPWYFFAILTVWTLATYAAIIAIPLAVYFSENKKSFRDTPPDLSKSEN